MRRVYLDSVGLIAVWNASDQWHRIAVDALRRITAENCDTFSSESVLLECGNASARTTFRDEVVTFRTELIEAEFLISPNESDIALAWEAFSKREAAGAGIVDQLSFVLMRRLGITEAFTNDAHFRAAGFVTMF